MKAPTKKFDFPQKIKKSRLFPICRKLLNCYSDETYKVPKQYWHRHIKATYIYCYPVYQALKQIAKFLYRRLTSLASAYHAPKDYRHRAVQALYWTATYSTGASSASATRLCYDWDEKRHSGFLGGRQIVCEQFQYCQVVCLKKRGQQELSLSYL